MRSSAKAKCHGIQSNDGARVVEESSRYREEMPDTQSQSHF